jgi:hypothetical protein
MEITEIEEKIVMAIREQKEHKERKKLAEMVLQVYLYPFYNPQDIQLFDLWHLQN